MLPCPPPLSSLAHLFFFLTLYPCFIVKFKVQWLLQVHCTQRPCNYSLSCLFLCGDAVSNSDNLYYRIHSMHGWSISWVCTNRAGAKKREDVRESATSTGAPFKVIHFKFSLVFFFFSSTLFSKRTKLFFLLHHVLENNYESDYNWIKFLSGHFFTLFSIIKSSCCSCWLGEDGFCVSDRWT